MELPAGEKILYESISWAVAKYLFRLKEAGFVYIPEYLIRSSSLQNGEEVRTLTVLAPHPKKKEWTWKGVRMLKNISALPGIS